MNKLGTRKNIRLKRYDYSEEGYYFITICTKERKNLLSKIVNYDDINCTIELTEQGRIVKEYIEKIEECYSNISIDEYIIMPNHIHIILIIKNKERNSISKVMQQFKGIVTKKLTYSIWQKLFYEHIIRSEPEYLQIKEYIINNPMNWKKDMYY